MLAITTAGLLAAMGSCPDGSEPEVQTNPFNESVPDGPSYRWSACTGTATPHVADTNPQTREHLCRASTGYTPCCLAQYGQLDANREAMELDRGAANAATIACIESGLSESFFEGLLPNDIAMRMAFVDSCGRGLRHIELPVVEDGETVGYALVSTVDCRHGLVSAGAVGGIVAGSVLGPFAVATAARALL